MTAPFLVAMTGGSGSGKSALCAALVSALPRGACALLSEDWYYKDVSLAPGFDPARFDFDDLAIRDHDLLISHLQALKGGAAVEAPRYSFVRHAQEAFTRTVAPAPVILVEGCHLLCRADLAAAFDLRVYIDAPADIRLIRRIQRDQAERGRSLESILSQYLRTVRPAHERLIAPARFLADLVLEDHEAGVGAPDAQSLCRLAAPLLEDPRLSALIAAGPQGPAPS